MEHALKTIGMLKRARREGRREGQSRVQSRAGTRRSTSTTCSRVSEAITRCAIERKESRGGHFRDDYPDKGSTRTRRSTSCVRRARDGEMQTVARADPADARSPQGRHRGDEIDGDDSGRARKRDSGRATPRRRRRRTRRPKHDTRSFKIWRGEQGKGEFVEYKQDVVEGMVVLDAVHEIQATQANDLAVRWNCKAGKCGSCSAEINGMPKLMCMTRLEELDADEAGDGRADARVPARARSRHRRVVELRGQEEDQEVHAAPARRARRHVADAAGGHRSRAGIPEVHRVLSVSGRLPRAARSLASTTSSSDRASSSTPRRSRCIRSTRRIACPSCRKEHGIGYCNITKCCTKVCPEHITITDNAIIPLKERVVDEFFDPIGKLVRDLRSIGNRRRVEHSCRVSFLRDG